LFEIFGPNPLVTLSFRAKRHSTTEDTEPCDHKTNKSYNNDWSRIAVSTNNFEVTLNQNIGGGNSSKVEFMVPQSSKYFCRTIKEYKR
jgi:hypothetical protein